MNNGTWRVLDIISLSLSCGQEKVRTDMVRTLTLLVKRIIANKNITIFKANNTELFCQVELPLSDYPLYGKQIAAS